MDKRVRDGSCLRTKGNFGRFWYTREKIMLASITTTTSLITPDPRNTVDVQAIIGTQIMAIEQETQMECKLQRMRPF